MLRSTLVALVASATLSACASSSHSAAPGVRGPAPLINITAAAPRPDPRLSLKAGWLDAEEAMWNMELVAAARPSTPFFNSSGATERVWNSDLAFTSHYVVQGNFSGFQIWDVSTPSAPRVATSYICGGVQGDVSVYKNLLFISVEENNARLDCSLQGVKDSVSTERFRGIRIFDIGDIAHPKQVADVQTCRGSHTNTVVTDPRDSTHVYIYVSAMAGTRSPSELAGCSDVSPQDEPNTQRFRIDVIDVPLAHPEQAKIVGRPALLADLAPYVRHEEYAADTVDPGERMLMRITRPDPEGARARRLSPLGPIATVCHDITTFRTIGLAGGACIGYGLLIDIRDPGNPRRVAAAADSNFFGWHSATFSNDGSEVLFSDEWGGGTLPRCRSTDNPRWGSDAIYTIAGDRMTLQGYYKLPVAQSSLKNCVAHNGSLIPIPGRNVMVQAWYQGGVSVFDWTDGAHVREIAYFDRGPIDSTKMEPGGTWSAYWYNGYIYSSEITRGLDVLALRPNGLLTQNEIDAANTVRFGYLNVQDQPQFVWPATFVLARAYLDQIARARGLPADRQAAVARDLAAAEKRHGDARRTLLTTLSSQLDGDAGGSTAGVKVRMLADVTRKLAAM
jgi:hypothetical protein